MSDKKKQSITRLIIFAVLTICVIISAPLLLFIAMILFPQILFSNAGFISSLVIFFAAVFAAFYLANRVRPKYMFYAFLAFFATIFILWILFCIADMKGKIFKCRQLVSPYSTCGPCHFWEDVFKLIPWPK